MPRLKSDLIAERASYIAELKKNPKSREEALAKGVAAGMRVRFQSDDGVHFGVVRSVEEFFVVIEQNGAFYTKGGRQKELFTGGKNVVVRVDKVFFSNVLDVMGKGYIAQPVAVAEVVRVAPDRDGGYEQCDFCTQKISVVQQTSKGLYALCKEHNENPHELPSGEYQAIVFKFGLGVLYESWKAWPVKEAEAGQ